MSKNSQESKSDSNRPPKIKVQKASSLLLTPGSSRRKSALKRLKAIGDSRGMTQDQISAYLEEHLKKQYQQQQMEGALTYDKIQKYLDRLAKLASEPLSKAPMDPSKIDRFSQKINPIITDIGSKTELTTKDIESHTRGILEQAVSHANECLTPTPIPKKQEEEEDAFGNIEIELLEDEDIGQENNNQSEIEQISNQSGSTIQTEPITQPVEEEEEEAEVIPIGFETGAPKVGIKTFFSFPLNGGDREPSKENPYQDHHRYLALALEKGVLTEEEFEAIKLESSNLPAKDYSRYFDIFPENEYEDARMMMVYSQWRNNALERLLVNNEESPA